MNGSSSLASGISEICGRRADRRFAACLWLAHYRIEPMQHSSDAETPLSL